MPGQLLTLSSPVLHKYLFHRSLEGVDVAKVKGFEVFLAEDGRAGAPSLENNVFILSIFDDEVKNIVELAGIVSIADHIEVKFLSWFKEGMFFLGLEDGDFLPGESMKLCLDLGIVDDRHLKEVVLEDLYLSEVKFFGSDYYFGTIGVGTDVEEVRLVVVGPNNVDVKRKGDLSQLASDEGDFKFLVVFGVDDALLW